MAKKLDLSPVLQATQPQEAIDYFRQKGYRIGFDHQDVWRQEHQAAFTVAKGMQIDLLQDVRAAVDAALADGTTLADFRRRLMPQLQARGWWGRQDVLDPVTGETVSAQLGSPRRLRVIYETNLATAYSEGQAERIEANKGLFEFLLYDGLNAANPRDAHKPWDGLVLRADDPWWNAHRPVKAWGCKCTVIQLSRRMMEREGYKEGQAPAEQLREVTNKRTGEVLQVPQGVDPAFHYPHGGRRANLGRMMMDKADASNARTAARLLQDGVDQWAPLVDQEFAEFVGRYAAGERREVGTRRVAGVLAPQAVANLERAGQPLGAATVVARMSKLAHLLGDNRSGVRRANGTGAGFVATLPVLLRSVGEAWLDGDSLVLLCSAPDELERVVKVVVRLGQRERGGELLENAVVSMHLIDPRDFTRKGLVRVDE